MLPEDTLSKINIEGPELRVRAAKQHAEQLARAVELSQKEEEEISGGAAIDKNKFAEKCSWPVPKLEELVPGLILEIRNRKPGTSTERTDYYEVEIGPEMDKSGEMTIKVLDMGTGRKLYLTLAELGIAPYESNKLWDARNYPAKWYMKQPEKGKREKKEREE